jgi:hypothetical protein
MHRSFASWGVATLAVALASVATAAPDAGSGVRGWGPRIGLAADPDQVLVGFHVDAGRISPRVRFQPDVEMGVGDDVFVLGFTAPVHYRFPASGDLKPYAGGGVTVGYWDIDRGRDDGYDDDDVEFAIDLIGGLEWIRRGGDLFFLEFDLLAGDLHDFQFVAGWTFR